MQTTPPPEHEAIMVACLCICPTCRAWATAMGVTETAFSHPDTTLLAGWFLSGGHVDAPGSVSEALARPVHPPGVFSVWGNLRDACEYYADPSWDPDHARLRAFQRAAQKTFPLWGHNVLIWAADRIKAGDTNVIQRAAELLAFMAWDIQGQGVWVYNPGEELRVKWPIEEQA